ncbi:hypothetical protein AJ80_02941 [Polytolypa hystricis UAMH7299]|uniref:AAA+ ATPase domain-containing protein n=1 Tax=Polytolypa hystricis (strain UAMH7299) TaxID=1447883 RepID=A0A2B7YN36_POLH7|nr:hypothetical protein AJ80_02941 [Polytolypa hystricis UAMH7299]
MASVAAPNVVSGLTSEPSKPEISVSLEEKPEVNLQDAVPNAECSTRSEDKSDSATITVNKSENLPTADKASTSDVNSEPGMVHPSASTLHDGPEADGTKTPNEETEKSGDNESMQDEPKVNAEEEEEEAKEEEKQEPLVVDVRKVNFEHFKNHYAGDKRYVLDVLMAGPDHRHEIHRLHVLRAWRDKMETAEQRSALLQDFTTSSARDKFENTWIQRIRIQSPGVLFHLSNVVGETWSTAEPRTFIRPFKVFIYFQPRMKETLAKLEKMWEGKEDVPDTALDRKAAVEDGKVDNKVVYNSSELDSEEREFQTDAAQKPAMYNRETLEAMRCYVNFFDNEVIPLYTMFDDGSRTKIRFEELWLLFRIGELVYASQNSDVRPRRGRDNNRDSLLPQSTIVWKVYTLNSPPDYREYPSFQTKRKPRAANNEDDEDDDEFSRGLSAFRVFGYYIDYDGVSYGPVKHRFTIPRFEGEMDIRALPVYPLRYAEDPELIQTLRQDGAKFKDLVGKKHLSYDGWTAASTPSGEPITVDEAGDHVKYPKYVESHVIVDFVEALQAFPVWKPQFHEFPRYGDDENWDSERDDYRILDWETGSQEPDIVQSTDGVNMWLRKDFLETDAFIKDYKAQTAPVKPGKEKTTLELRDEDLILLPKRLFGYVLRDREFVTLDIRSLHAIQPQQDVFSRLKILREYRDILKSLVASHFVGKDLEKKMATQGLTQDVIQGKGRALVILLHGVPGVGKTATAEAVALEYQASPKPLFVISCGDVGLTPEQVEKHLNEVFRLAHLWDCVLLLDEADVFLAARNNHDLKRNALVSVFLRVLEYYSGILFLTTNRVGTLDEAFKSRIHITLYYPALGELQAKAIFKVNINRLDEIAQMRSKITGEPKLWIAEEEIIRFAKKLYNRKSEDEDWVPWNGRQIRNAFQVASSLAYNEMHVEYANRQKKAQLGEIERAEYPTPVLNETHFEIVAKVTDDFDDYMREVKGKNDSMIAFLHGERADQVKGSQNLGMSKISFSTSAYQSTPESSNFGRQNTPQAKQRSRRGGHQNPQRRSGREPFAAPPHPYDRQAQEEEHESRGYQDSEGHYEEYRYHNKGGSVTGNPRRVNRADEVAQEVAYTRDSQDGRGFRRGSPSLHSSPLQRGSPFDQQYSRTPSKAQHKNPGPRAPMVHDDEEEEEDGNDYYQDEYE